jgi:hypothetical protein
MRSRETQPGVELLPSPTAIVRARTGVDEVELNKAVREQVLEIMAERDALAFEPFFRSRQVSYELKRLQSVPEQQKFSIAYERYGCLHCGTKEAIHAGNNLCNNCRALWFRRYSQIIAEGVTGRAAQRARGAAWEERRLDANRPMDAPRQTFYEPSSKEDKDTFRRVAFRLGVDPSHVRAVAVGKRTSERVTTALKEERAAAQKHAIGDHITNTNKQRQQAIIRRAVR